MRYFFFLDETGDHGLSYIDKNFPLFLLCGTLIREDNLRFFEEEVNNFKRKYFKTDKIVLHSREIRRCEGPFQILFDLDLKAKFYNDLNTLIGKCVYYIVGAGINKEEHIRRYGKSAKDPYSLSLSFVMERVIFCLDKMDPASVVEVVVEERGRKEDSVLLSHYNLILDRGTYYVSPERIKKKVVRFDFHPKRDNIIGLQLADLCAYPLARNILNPEVSYIPFNIIEKKIYCNEKEEYMGWGLKIFP